MNNEAFMYLLNCDLNELITDLKRNGVLNDKIKSLSNKINRNCSSYCGSYVSNLQVEELVKLIMAYTIIEKYLWFMGSATAIPTLLDVLKERSYAQFARLVDWVIIINDGSSQYIPFGAVYYSECKSYAEFLKLKAEKEISTIKGDLDAKLRGLEKIEKVRSEANLNIWDAIRRLDTAAIESLVEKGVDFNLKNIEGVTVAQMLHSLNINYLNETSQKYISKKIATLNGG